MESRILVLALKGRDAQVISQVLGKLQLECHICLSAESLAQELASGALTAIITEESLVETDLRRLDAWLAGQPAWSDFPFVLLATKRSGRRPKEAAEVLHRLGNVVVLERPVHSETLTSAATSAVRARRRQYEARLRLHELEAAEERLSQLNDSLEARISQRTKELSSANNQLMQEIAERERVQAALVQWQKMEAVGQLTGGIAHDFNNLLTAISGNLELIKRRTREEKIATFADYAMQAVDRAAKLTRQLLAFSRSQKLTLKPVDINALIQGMNNLLARTIGPLFSIEMRLASSDPIAVADPNQVELAILNLVINARDAMPDGGALLIETACEPAGDPSLRPGDYVVIKVIDTGTGIPRHLLEKVFDPFFTTKPLGKGTGLGLSQVYGIAQQSRGTVRVESVEGQGTMVEIWLPATKLTEAVESTAPPPPVTHDQRQEPVLVIEDDDAVRRFIVDCLQSLGYRVIEASRGYDGLERLRAEKPRLMIVDFAMPGLNGLDVVNAARTETPDLPIILATGYADMEAVHKVIDPAHVLKKPFLINDLEQAVLGALQTPG